MPQLLSVSRAARLVGLSRGAVQRKIQDGELRTFEGLVRPADLLSVFPDAQLDPDKEFDRVMKIQANAFGKRIADRILPDAEVLSARLRKMGQELASAKTALKRYRTVFQQLGNKLEDESLNHKDSNKETASSLRKWLSAAMKKEQSSFQSIEPLLLQDSLLSIMSAHVHLQPSGHEFFVEGQDSILEAALRSGLNPDYRCSNGNCGACKARIVSGEVRKTRNHDYVIGEADKINGYVLLCCNTAVTDLVVEVPEARDAEDIPLQKIKAQVQGAESLTDDTLLLSLKTPRTNRLRFLAGQSAKLTARDNNATFPIASCPCDDRNIQFYIHKSENDPFSDYVFKKLQRDDKITIEGPFGDYVFNEDSPRSLIFVAWDEGYAPINSLIEHAMALEVAEHMHLYRVVSPDKSHFHDNQCRAWADAIDNFHYDAFTSARKERDSLNHIFRQHKKLDDYDIYIAGPGAAINSARQLLDNRAFPSDQIFTQIV
jgi:CDP-4-dehydro-6-deoxyglucose reductase, E3